MMNSGKNMAAILSVAVLVAGLTACEKTETAAEEKGPAQRAGEQIDKAAAKAGEEINEIAEKAGQGLQKAGEKLQNATQEAEKKE
jgi:hypothetical protein